MKICSKCGYIRQPNDDICISPLECPKCGIVYKKHEDYLKQKRIEQEVERKVREHAERSAREQAETEPGQEILNVSENKSVIKNFTNKLSMEFFFGTSSKK